jgi:hypothetical protein
MAAGWIAGSPGKIAGGGALFELLLNKQFSLPQQEILVEE